MLKQVMNNNNARFYILLCIIYVIQLCQSKVAHRRGDDDGTNAEQGNLIAVDDPEGSTKQSNPITADDPEGSQLNPIAADDTKENLPSSDKDEGPKETLPNSDKVEDPKGNLPKSDKDEDPKGNLPKSDKDEDPKGNAPNSDKDEDPKGNLPNSDKDEDPQGDLPNPVEPSDPKGDLPNTYAGSDEKQPNQKPVVNDDGEKQDRCWISLKEQSYFEKMSQLEQKYKNARDAYVKSTDIELFNQRMLHAMMKSRGIAERALQKFKGNPNVIPAGLNLGSYCMMRMPGSMLFFHRLKLRNDTRFTVNYIHNDLDQLTLTLRLSLNDLHLIGEYERALTSKEDPSKLYYKPNKGEIEFYLKDVKYKVEGRYRLLDGRLHIEHIISEIPPMFILMRYKADTESKSKPLDPNSLRDYLKRMQTDLDQWLKDYFNDFLLLYGTEELKKNNEIQEFQNEKTILLNNFADQVMVILNNRLREKGPNLMMPNFLLTAANGMEIRLYDGVVRGLDSMYRRSVTTGKRGEELRHVDAEIGFSKLKAEYRYDVYVKTGVPPLTGVFVLNSDDVSAHMALQIVGYKPAVPDLLITYMRHGKPESLTVEGPANRIIANFKHLLEHHIISIMSSTLIHHIGYLSALTKCDPQLPVIEGESIEDNKETNDKVTTEDYVDITTAMDPTDADESTEPPASNDPKPTESPEDKSDDDGKDDGGYNPEGPESTVPQDNTGEDAPKEPSDNDDVAAGTKEQQNPKNDLVHDNTNNNKPEYAFVRKESIELELPPKDGAAQSYKLDHNETFSLTKLNNDNDPIVPSWGKESDVAGNDD